MSPASYLTAPPRGVTKKYSSDRAAVAARDLGAVDLGHEAPREGAQHRQRDCRLVLEQLLELHAADGEAEHRRDGPDPGAARCIVDEPAQLAEELPGAELDRRVPILDCDRPVDDNV